MPARRVSNRGGNIIGAFPSLKNGCQVHYESTIERDFLFFLEFDLAVLSYELQPFVINAPDSDGKLRSYTPDILITRTTGKEVIECKPAARLSEAHTKQQVALGEAWCAANNCHYIVVTDVGLRTGSKLANLKLLWRYARLSVPYTVLEDCKKLFVGHSTELPFCDLINSLTSAAKVHLPHSTIYHLLFHHILTTDLQEPLSPKSLIKLAALH